MSILLIDDQAQPRQEARKVLEQMLTEPIIEFHDPQQALQYYTTHPEVELIVTDIVMPGITGIELAQKALEHKKVPIVLHTGSWARDTLYRLTFNGALDQLPITIANKAYFFETEEQYQEGLEHKIAAAQEKAATVTSINTAPLQEITKRLHIKDTLVDYVKTIYDELFTQLDQAINQVPEAVISAEKKAKITGEKPDLTQQTTEFFMHNLRYPLQTLTMLLLPYLSSPEAAQAISILEKMADIKEYIETESTKFSPSMADTIAHKRELKGQTRKPLPRNNPPTKLANRERMLQAEGTPYIIIRPEETYQSQADSLFTESEKVIVRSMSAVEDNALPFAGYFDSIVAEIPQDVSQAIERVRKSHSKDLERFCAVRGYELPTAQDMTILIEPYRETAYVGSVLEHPTKDNLLLIEFVPRNYPGQKESMVYNKETKKVEIYLTAFDTIEIQKIAQALAQHLDSAKKTVGTQDTTAYQMEFGFSISQDLELYTFQLRAFQPKQTTKEFSIQNPLEARTIFGATPQQGIECIIASTTDSIELDLISKRAEAEQLQVLYIAKDNKPNVPFCTNVAVLITGKDLAVQAHNYFNPLSQSEHAVLMTQAEIAELRFEPGQRVRYTSNGTQAEMIKLDTTESIKYRIRDILNQ